MAFHLENVPSLAALSLRIPGRLVGNYPSGPRSVSLLGILQFSAILAAAVLTAITFWRVRVRFADRGIEPARGCWIVLRGLCLVYVLAALALVTLRGLHG